MVSNKKGKKNKQIFRAPKGMPDILPKDQIWWEKILEVGKEVSSLYDFSFIETPLLESAGLFEASLGANSDVVEKQMFMLNSKGGQRLVLRPEATASICRAYLEHHLGYYAHPLKVFYFGPMFRYDQPQAGRYRQFHQFGFEILGSASPASDAQMILAVNNILIALGLNNFSIKVNSVGCASCRPRYRENLISYYEGQTSRLCPHCKKRLKSNPLRLLDCKEEKCQRLANNAPVLLDSLCDSCHDHLKEVLEHLDELEIVYNLNPRLVRGLDYYTKTVFEIWPGKGKEEGGGQSALGGGGRYDNLISELGGEETPAVGFSCGVERILAQLSEKKVAPPSLGKINVFLAQLGELGRRKALVLFEEFRQAGIILAESFSRGSLKSQLKVADRLDVKITLILGQKEALEGTILLRDMETGVQELVRQEKIIQEVKRRLEKEKGK